mgnify:CR=1 FL=1|tara:strand:- start:36 stop:209 length:174 start_codon:yes stop_codon:yes gene_type:complete
MKKIIFITFFLLNSCSTFPAQNKSDFNINFSENLTIDEFKIRLEKYVENNSYPNIDF